MTKEEAIKMIKAIKNGLHETGKDFPYRDEIIPIAKEALDMAITELEQEPCADAISRQAAINLIESIETERLKGDVELIYAPAIKGLRALPPVTPQYTDAEIQKMQDLEFAEIQKAYEIGKDEGSEVLDKIRAEIKQAADKQFQIAIGVADLNERYTHIQMENAYRHSLNIIDKYKAESEDKE